MGWRGAFRIRKPEEVDATAESLDAAAPKSADDYMQRLIKLIPSEVIGIYLIGRQTAGEHQYASAWAEVCLVLVVIFRAIATSPEGTGQPFYKGIQWVAVLASLISFVIWVHAMGDRLHYLDFFEPWMASLAVLVWGILIPLFIKGDAPSQG